MSSGLRRVASRLDEVDACVNAVVDNVHAVDLVLSFEVCIKSLFNVLDDGPPGVVVVHKVTKARCIDDGQAQTYTVLFNVGTDGLDGDSFWDDFHARAFSFSWRVERGVEQRIDQGRLAQARFT